MNSAFRRIGKRLGLTRRPLTAADIEHRTQGDAARDGRDWPTAAKEYRAYLNAAPHDFGIWVQYGHALKEDRRLAEADAAYGRALKLRPRDPDLLVNYGHLRKMRNDLRGALAFYERSAASDLLPGVLAEIGSPIFTPYLSAERREWLDVHAGRALVGLLSGLTLLNSRDVMPVAEDLFALTSHDPWLEFKPDRVPADADLAELSFEIAAGAEKRPVSGYVYVDYGDGYSEDLKFWLGSHDSEVMLGAVSLFLAAPAAVKRIRWDPDDKSNQIRIRSVRFRPDVAVEDAVAKVKASYPPEIEVEDDIRAALAALPAARHDRAAATKVTRRLAPGRPDHAFDYEFWIKRWIAPRRRDYQRMEEMTAGFARRPTFSFVMPVYNPPPELLIECIESMLSQTYPDFEICIADDRSPNSRIVEILDRYARQDERIKFKRRSANGHISAASNTALDMATGDFVVLVDHDDLVPDYCLFVVADAINRHPNAGVLFSDEDKVSVAGQHFSPYFKGDYDRFLQYGHNMVSHLGVYRRDVLTAIGGFRLGFEGSQDYDLLLRAAEQVGDENVIHIPHILYHWRAIPGSTAVSADQKDYAIGAAQLAINGHFERKGIPLKSTPGIAPGLTAVVPTREPETRVSIIIPTRDGLDDLKACVDSILSFDHENAEIIVVDNGSEEKATLRYLDRLEKTGEATVLRYPHAFNFSSINNFAVEHATGDILCFLNNDTEVLASTWLRRARCLLEIEDVGMVGARLLYPDGTLQHFGLAVGMGAHKVAGSPHQGIHADDPGHFGKARLLRQFSAVTAACMFVRRSVFEQVGGFDPDLRVAYNDVDLCLKVRKAGFKIVGDPEILLTHKESKTRGSDSADASKANAKRLEDEAKKMRDRWADMLDHDPFWSPNHCLTRDDFALSNPPRIPMPWRREDPVTARSAAKRLAGLVKA